MFEQLAAETNVTTQLNTWRKEDIGASDSAGFYAAEDATDEAPQSAEMAIHWLNSCQNVQAWSGWADICAWDKIRADAIEHVTVNDDYVEQPRSWTCGPTAVSGTLARKEPFRYVRYLYNLYTSGRFTYALENGQRVNHIHGWSRQVTDELAATSIRGAAELIETSMRNTGTWWRRNYVDQTGEFVNATFPWEVSRWSKTLLNWNAKDIIWTNFNPAKIPRAINHWNIIANRTENTAGYLLINSGWGQKDDEEAFKGSADRQKAEYDEKDPTYERLEDSLPNHWVQLTGPILVIPDKVSFSVIDHGHVVTKAMTRERFARSVFAYVAVGRRGSDLR